MIYEHIDSVEIDIGCFDDFAAACSPSGIVTSFCPLWNSGTKAIPRDY